MQRKINSLSDLCRGRPPNWGIITVCIEGVSPLRMWRFRTIQNALEREHYGKEEKRTSNYD